MNEHEPRDPEDRTNDRANKYLTQRVVQQIDPSIANEYCSYQTSDYHEPANNLLERRVMM